MFLSDRQWSRFSASGYPSDHKSYPEQEAGLGAQLPPSCARPTKLLHNPGLEFWQELHIFFKEKNYPILYYTRYSTFLSPVNTYFFFIKGLIQIPFQYSILWPKHQYL